MIKGEDLQNRANGQEPYVTRPSEPPEEQGSEQAITLARRISEAKKLRPMGADLHCAQCWQRGRDAAIKTIAGEA